MRRTSGGLMVIALLLAACGGAGDSVVGTYECGLEGQPTREVWELREGGELTVTPDEPGLGPWEGTWSMEGDQVIINSSDAGTFTVGSFTVEEDRLVLAGPPGGLGTICTRTG